MFGNEAKRFKENKEQNGHVRKFIGQDSIEGLELDALGGGSSDDFSAGVGGNPGPRRRSRYEGRGQ
jgi:hypothetical protein